MHCVEIRKRLDAWVDGELPVPEAEVITRHLTACPACRLEAEGLQRITAAMDNLPPLAAPAGLYRRTMAAFRTATGTPGMREWWQELSLAMRGAVCGAALAGLLCGAVLGTSLTTLGADKPAAPYQTLYVSQGILP
jgi:anti-sigma factor RsiW